MGIQGFSRLSAHPAPGTGTYYPRFVDNNTVVAAHEEYSKFSLEYFDLEKTKVHPWWVPGVKKEPGAAVLANYALGSLWHNVCWAGKGQDIPSLTQQSLLVQNINPEDCVRLIEKNWERLAESIKDSLKNLKRASAEAVSVLKKTDLLAACPLDSDGSERIAVKAAPLSAEQIASQADEDVHRKKYVDAMKKTEAVFQEKCMTCHQRLQNKLDLGSMTADQLFDVSLKVKLKQMPPTEGLVDDDDRLELISYFRSIAALTMLKTK